MPSLANKRRETEVFSLAFLDCICCGFGAVILIFILSIIQKRNVDQESVDSVRARVQRMESQVSSTQDDVNRLSRLLAAAQLELPQLDAKNTQDELKLSDRKRQLLLMLQETGMLKEALANLLGEKKALPTDDHATVPIPNIDRHQYLTGFKLEGECVLFLVRASGSMLDENVDDATARLSDNEFKKREAPKWRRTLHALQWMLASLGPESRFQILIYNDETVPLLPARSEEWFSTSDRQAVSEILAKLNSIVPQGSANLERAFGTIRNLSRLPDSVVLFTDGLPTSSDSYLSEGSTTDEQRIRFFREATRVLPERIPVSTILFPMSGDPAAPALYWELANRTRGSLVSPSKSWPDT